MELSATTSDLILPDGLEQELAEAEALKLIEEERQIMEQARSDLAFSVEKKFEERSARRRVKEAQWLDAMRLYMGSLAIDRIRSTNPDRPFEEVKSKHRPDFNIVRSKCDIAVAQCVSMQFAGGEKNWNLRVSPDADLMADPMAPMRARLMEDEIEGQLLRTSYGRKSRTAIEDRVILGTGILKGPINVGEVCTEYEQIGDNLWVPKVGVDYTLNLEYVNPWFWYPDDTTNDPSKIQDSIEIHPMNNTELTKLAKHPGFDSGAIYDVLEKTPKEFESANYADFATLTESNPYLFKNKYLVLEYHGPITRDQLNRLSIEPPAYDSPIEEYYGEVWVCDGKIIRIELSNLEGYFEIPYAVSVWKKDPSSVFGFGAPLLMRDAQRVVTQTWHMILDNASLSSGPQIVMHKSLIEPADRNWTINPRKVWYHKDFTQSVDNAFSFHIVPNVIADLMPVLNSARQFAEEESLTPMIAGGMQSPEVTESATGLAILRQSSTTLLDFLSEDWDDDVTEKVIRRCYAWNMQYNPKPDIKGRFKIDVRSSTEYRNKQLFVKDLEKLSLEASQNPAVGKVVNMDALTRARLAMMHIPNDDIIKTPEQVQEEEANAGPTPEQMEAEARMKELEIAERKVANEERKLEFQSTLEQRRAEMEHEQAQMQAYARISEAEASVLREASEERRELAKLAQKDGVDQASIMAQLAEIQIGDERERFLAGLEATRHARKDLLLQKEFEYAQREGKGVF